MRPSPDGPALDFSRLREVSIEGVLASRGIRLQRRGARRVGPCPLHGGDNPGAFVVDTRRNRWHCFTRCGPGDVIDLVARIDRIGLHAAARHLAAIAPDLPLAAAFEVRPRDRPFQPFAARLPLDHDCVWLRGRGIFPDTARHYEAGAWHGGGMLQGCVAVRLHDPQGRPLGYAGRRTDPQAADRLGKWKFPSAFPKGDLLYNLHRLGPQQPQTVVLVEGPWDVLRLAQIGVPALALLGAHMTEQQARLLRSALAVVVILDGDQTGRDGAADIVRRLKDARRVDLPDGRDPASIEERALGGLLAPFFSL